MTSWEDACTPVRPGFRQLYQTTVLLFTVDKELSQDLALTKC